MTLSEESPEKAITTAEVVKTLIRVAGDDEELKKSLGKRTIHFLLATCAMLVVGLTYNIPFITTASAPLMGAVITFLIASVEDWMRSKKPKTIYYLCPYDKKFIRINRSSLSHYRKLKSCPKCGVGLIKRCQQGKHYIVSPDFEHQKGHPPRVNGFCPFCDPKIPEEKRRYLPPSNETVATIQ